MCVCVCVCVSAVVLGSAAQCIGLQGQLCLAERVNSDDAWALREGVCQLVCHWSAIVGLFVCLLAYLLLWRISGLSGREGEGERGLA